MPIALANNWKSITPASPLAITVAPAANDYLIAVYTDDHQSGTYTLDALLTQDDLRTSTADSQVYITAHGRAVGTETSISSTNSVDPIVGIIAAFSGVHRTAANDAAPVSNGDSSGVTTGRTLSITTVTPNTMLVVAIGWDTTSVTDPTTTMSDNAGGLSWTVINCFQAAGFRKAVLAYALMPTPGSVTVTMTPATAAGWGATLYALKPAAAVFEQEGYRFRNDDGSETSATWAAAQDTNVTLAAGVNVRLRMIVNATNDPTSQGYKLQFREVGAAQFQDVKIGEP